MRRGRYRMSEKYRLRVNWFAVEVFALQFVLVAMFLAVAVLFVVAFLR